MMTKISEQTAAQYADEYDLGWRFVDHAVKPGDKLINSRHWDGEVITDQVLRGTCCWDTEARCREYAKYSKGCIVLVGGTYCGGGDLGGEVIIADAVALAVEEV